MEVAITVVLKLLLVYRSELVSEPPARRPAHITRDINSMLILLYECT